MIAQIIDGKALAAKIRNNIAVQIKERMQQGLRAPQLAAILVGENSASKIYVRNKCKACAETGMISKRYNFAENTDETALLRLIDELNADDAVDGILVQLPLPLHISVNHVLERINPKKDVDGFHPYNVGRLAIGAPTLRPCTPKGIMVLLESTKINLQGLDAVIIGASNIVGKPMALELLMKNCTVSVCHIYTKNIASYVKQADLVITAAGVPNLVKGEWIKEGAIVIDVGINRLADGKIVGDVEFNSVKEKASWITPVPGGVGPMTVAMLLENTLKAMNSE